MQTTHTEQAHLEANELNLLTETAKPLTIERTERPRGLWGHLFSRIRGKRAQRRTETIGIKPLTLGTILKISREGQRLEMPKELAEERADTLPDLSHHWASVEANAPRLARIISIAVLGGRASEDEINHLSEDILHSITPTALARLCLEILSASDLVGFTNSIRLMRASRVTNPDLIEKED